MLSACKEGSNSNAWTSSDSAHCYASQRGRGQRICVAFRPLMSPAAPARETASDRHRRMLLPARGSNNGPGPRQAPVRIFCTLSDMAIANQSSIPAPQQRQPDPGCSTPIFGAHCQTRPGKNESRLPEMRSLALAQRACSEVRQHKHSPVVWDMLYRW
jgi:hypothetical protein